MVLTVTVARQWLTKPVPAVTLAKFYEVPSAGRGRSPEICLLNETSHKGRTPDGTCPSSAGRIPGKGRLNDKN
jgi:hypothetical protein